MDDVSTGHLIIELPLTRKRLIMPPEIIKNLDHVYRSNPYPSKSEYENMSKDVNIPFQRVKNWFSNRRRRDTKSGKICRQCRFFQAPINEQTHLENVNRRPCISYWSLPTVAPPPMSFPSAEIGHSSLAVENSEGKDDKLEASEDLPTSSADNVVPSALLLSVQPGSLVSEKSIFTSEITARYIHQQQRNIGHYPMEMVASNSWMMPATGSSFWPMPLHNYCQPPDGQQVPLDYHLPPDWRAPQMHRSLTNYSLHYEPYPQYMKTEKGGSKVVHLGSSSSSNASNSVSSSGSSSDSEVADRNA